MSKTPQGYYFEDFMVGQEFVHATPRTVTSGDQAVFMGLFGSRYAVQSCDFFARSIGYPQAPLDDFLVFHFVFGKSVPDISLNAVANLGYAKGIFHKPVFRGDSIRAKSKVIGLKHVSNGTAGIVYVSTEGFNQHGELLLEYSRLVMVKKRHPSSPPIDDLIPLLPSHVEGKDLPLPKGLNLSGYDFALAGRELKFQDYHVGEKIHHRDGITIEESDHMFATRLYQNNAKIHFNQHVEQDSRFKRRLIYGGHIISLARSLSFNGLENAFLVAGINGGRHVAPCFAGDTIYAYSEVLDKHESEHPRLGALRLRLVALKNENGEDFPYKNEVGDYNPNIVLDFDYWVWVVK